MAMGPIMAIGGVDMLIPPSALTVLLATLASSVSRDKVSVSDLLIAGHHPGLIMSVCFLIWIVVRCWMRPDLAPQDEAAKVPMTLIERWRPFFIDVVPLVVHLHRRHGKHVHGMGLADRFGGTGLPGHGRAGAVLSGAQLEDPVRQPQEHRGRDDHDLLHHRGLHDLRPDPGLLRRHRRRLAEIAKYEFTPLIAVFVMIAILLVLGCFMDQISMMLLTFPFFMPLANALNMDLVWLGVILLISLQIGLLTPPFGCCCSS
jgi:TRAP-type C4-dicarboxylate transport system permease large subunit